MVKVCVRRATPTTVLPMTRAGFETTAHSIAWTLFCLACHEAALERVCDELQSLGLLAIPDWWVQVVAGSPVPLV